MSENRVIYYNEDKNVFVDECGYEIINIYREINPNIISLFRYNQCDMKVYDSNGDVVWLSYIGKYDGLFGELETPIDLLDPWF
jgi:hypothetical protein